MVYSLRPLSPIETHRLGLYVASIKSWLHRSVFISYAGTETDNVATKYVWMEGLVIYRVLKVSPIVCWGGLSGPVLLPLLSKHS